MGPLLITLCLVAAAAAREPLDQFQDNYHELVGIPLASKIKKAEDALMSGGSDGSRVVGGSPAPINQHPYLAGLIVTFTSHPGTSLCGSTLLSSNRLITAAHCWYHSVQAKQFVVVLGSQYLFYGGTRVTTSNVILHPEYMPRRLFNDIGIIFLPTNVVFTDSIQPIALPSGNELLEQFSGEWAVAAGYGMTSDQHGDTSPEFFVSHVSVRVITLEQCMEVYGLGARPTNICTSGEGGVGICNGDSGGPLVLNRNGRKILVGIASFIFHRGCELGFPSGFSRITSFYNFIMQYM